MSSPSGTQEMALQMARLDLTSKRVPKLHPRTTPGRADLTPSPLHISTLKEAVFEQGGFSKAVRRLCHCTMNRACVS